MPRQAHRVFSGDSCMSTNDMATVVNLRHRSATVCDTLAFYELACQHYGITMLGSVEFTMRHFAWRRGTYCRAKTKPPGIQTEARILVHGKGENCATVVHELAHHVATVLDGSRGHDAKFARRFRELLDLGKDLLY